MEVVRIGCDALGKHAPDLLRAFVDEFDRIAPFAGGRPHVPENFLARAEETAQFPRPRAEMANLLIDYNRALGAPEPVIENARSLERARTVAVITGQQPALFGGPLLVLYKALTAIALCEKLNGRSEYRFVPIFWNHSDDHDHNEVDRYAYVDEKNRLRKIRVNLAPRNAPLSGVKVTEAVRVFAREVLETLPDTEYSSEVKKAARRSVRGMWGTSASLFLSRLLGNRGLVLYEPHLGRQLAEEIHAKEVMNPHLTLLSVERAAYKMDAMGLKAPLILQTAPNLFLVHKGIRRKLIFDGDVFRAQGLRDPLSMSDLEQRVRDHPQEFSAGVALRPIVQDTLFPTVAYVAGPSELGYHLQLGTLYEELGIPRPILCPRFGATLVEPKVRRVVEKFGVPRDNLLHLRGDMESLMEAHQDPEIQNRFHDARAELIVALRSIRKAAIEVDPTLTGAYEKHADRILHAFRRIREKTLARQRENNQIGKNQIEKAAQNLLPGGQLQERVLGVLPYLCRYGPDLPERILAQIDPFEFRHAIVDLP